MVGTDPLRCGLCGRPDGSSDKPMAVSMIGCHVEAVVSDLTAEVHLLQFYRNDSPKTLNTMYIFPLDANSAVADFRATLDGVDMQGRLMEKQAARDVFRQASARGSKASLLESNDSPEIFQVQLSNLPAGAMATIHLTYFSALHRSSHSSSADQGAINFYVPTRVAPRYTPFEWAASNSARSSWENLMIPLRSCVRSRRPTTSSSPPASDDPCAFSMVVSIKGVPVKEIQCPSHPTECRQTMIDGQNAEVSFQSQGSPLDRDLELRIITTNPHAPRAWLETDPADQSQVMMVNLVPHFDTGSVPCEIIFIVDRSGSMQGQKIAKVRMMLSLFLRALPADCFFNIVSFGDRFSLLFPQSVPYNDENLQVASALVDGLSADLGGTEILRPLEHLFGTPCLEKRPRQIFLLTDGEVGNTAAVISLVAKSCHQDESEEIGAPCSRVFTIGVGENVSHHLVEGVARAGKGSFCYASVRSEAKDDQLAPLVLRQLKDAVQPHLTQLKINWPCSATVPPSPSSSSLSSASTGIPETLGCGGILSGIKETGKSVMGSLLSYVSPNATGMPQLRAPPSREFRVTSVMQAPHNLPPLHSGSQFAAYAFLPEHFDGHSIRVSAYSPADGALLESEVPVSRVSGNLIHRLAARAALADLQDGTSRWHLGGYQTVSSDVIKQQIVSLALRFGLVSNHTSFVAYDGSPIDPHDDDDDEGGQEKSMMRESFCLSSAQRHPQAAFASVVNRGVQLKSMSSAFSVRTESAMADSDDDEAADEEEDEVDDVAEAHQINKSDLFKGPQGNVGPTGPSGRQGGSQSDEMTDLLELIKCQKASGEFELAEPLAKCLRRSLETMHHERTIRGLSESESVWACALACSYLFIRFPSHHDLWEMCAKKTTQWITLQGIDEKRFDELIRLAGNYFASCA